MSDLLARARAALDAYRATADKSEKGIRALECALLVPELIAEVKALRAEVALTKDGYNIRPMTAVESNLMTQVLTLRRERAALEQAVARVRELCADPPISDIDRYRDGDWRLDADILKGLITAVFDALDETGTPVTEIDPEIDKAVREAMTGLIAKVNALQLAARGALRQLNLYLESGERLRLHVATASLESVLPDGRTEAP